MIKSSRRQNLTTDQLHTPSVVLTNMGIDRVVSDDGEGEDGAGSLEWVRLNGPSQ